MDYWHYNFICPYFVWDTEKAVGCEGNHSIKFDRKEDAKRFMRDYCADWKWGMCPHALTMNKKYEGKGETK